MTQPHPERLPTPAIAAGGGCLTVFAALGHFGEPNPANRFAASNREVLFAM